MIDWAGENVVVTGGAGFIGSHVVDVLVRRGASVRIIDDLSRGTLRNIARHLHLQTAVLDAVDLLKEEPSWPEGSVVFHMAARVTNIKANRSDHLGMLQHNIRVNSSVVEAMRKARPKLAVLVSTVCVYPHNAPVPTPEEAAFPFHPEDTNEGYGLAKAILEKQAEYLHRECGVPVVVPRFSNAFGLRDYYDWESSHVVPALIRKVHEKDEVVVWGSGNQTRVFVDARDIALALVDLAEREAAWDARPVNIGHAREVSIRELVELIVGLSGKDVPVRYDTTQPDGHARRAVDNSRLKSLIGWVPDTPLGETIFDMIREYRMGGAHL